MAYFDFPHTRNYDTDLGYLIKKYQDLEKEYKTASELYSDIKEAIAVLITDMVNDGIIFLSARYVAEDEKIKFIFDSTGLDTHTYTSNDESLNIKLSYLEEKGLLPKNVK